MSLGKWIGFVAIIIALYVLWEIRQLLLLILTAVILATAINVLVRWLQEFDLKRGWAVLLALLMLTVVLTGFGWIIVPPFTNQLIQLFELVPQGIEQFTGWIELLEDRLPTELLDAIPDVNQITSQLQPFVNELLGRGWTFFSSSLTVLLNVLLVIILTLMFLADPEPYQRGFIRLFPSFYRRRVQEILVLCRYALQSWLAGILFNMAVITVLSFLGLLFLGIPLALAQALLAGLLTFIPNIGPALSVIPPIAIALLEDPWKALAVLILYIAIQQIESNLLTPLVMAQQVSLLPAVTLLAQVFFASLFGFLGLFLALPLTVIAQVWIKEVIIKDILDNWPTKENRQTSFPDMSNTTFEEVPSGARVVSETQKTAKEEQTKHSPTVTEIPPNIAPKQNQSSTEKQNDVEEQES
ncbi:MAG: AI-2E family transporter [Chroococcales cyanobacterium]